MEEIPEKQSELKLRAELGMGFAARTRTKVPWLRLCVNFGKSSAMRQTSFS